MLLNMKIILRALQLYKKQILPINILFKDLNKSLEVGSGGWSFGHNLGPNVRLVVGFPQRRENNAFHKCRLWSIYKFGNKLDKVIHSLSILFWTLLLGSVVVGFRSIIVKYSFSVVESGSVVVGSVSLSFSTNITCQMSLC